VKLAVYVVAVEGAVTECEIAPPSDQLPKTYCVPVAPACGDVVATVCDVPAVHWRAHGAVQAVPSTVSARPAGEEVTVMLTGKVIV
jgi:hypothetical protein